MTQTEKHCRDREKEREEDREIDTQRERERERVKEFFIHMELCAVQYFEFSYIFCKK